MTRVAVIEAPSILGLRPTGVETLPDALLAGAGGFWIHVDADALDDAIMPAVDYRLPGGLSWEELTSVLSLSIKSRRAVGLEVTIYNPQFDPDRTGARGLVRVIGDALR
jgi:arginase